MKKNLKHTVLALITVAMISALATKQGMDFSEASKERIRNITADTSRNVITITEKESEGGTAVAFAVASDEENESEEAAENKKEIADEGKTSYLKVGYVNLSSGTLAVRQMPSAEAAVSDRIEKLTEVQIMGCTEGWYKVSYSGGKTGYVRTDFITEDYSEAAESAKNYDNYKKGHITTKATVRTGASSSSQAVLTLSENDTVTVLGSENGYAKIAYGPEYTEGYITEGAVSATDGWIAKSEVTEVQERVKAELAAAQKKAKEEAEAKAAAEKAAAESKAAAEAKARAAVTPSAGAVSQSTPAAVTGSASGSAIVNTAKNYLGIRYVWGGSSPSGFDCSGLVQYVCAKNGISLPRTAREQAKVGVAVSRDNLQPGDLLFFAKNGTVHHVGIYVGNGQMIHAPQTGDVVKYSSINTSYRVNGFYCARRVTK